MGDIKMSVQAAIENIVQKNIEEMRNNINIALTEKAVSKLDEKKQEIASKYFKK